MCDWIMDICIELKDTGIFFISNHTLIYLKYSPFFIFYEQIQLRELLQEK